jgi:ankyrin repeat protein
MRSAIKEGEAASTKLLVRWALENERAQLLPSKALKIGGHDVDKIVEILSKEVPEIKDNGGTRDNILQAMAHKGDVINVTRLLELGADIDNRAGAHGTPLMAAVSNGKLDVFDLILDRGANPMITIKRQDGAGPAAMDIAAVKPNEQMVSTLLARGARFLHQSLLFSEAIGWMYGYSLQVVSKMGVSPKIARLLLEHGADVNAAPTSFVKRANLQSPAQLAAGAGHETILRILLEYQADVNFRGHDGFGTSPLLLAVQGGHIACVRLLLSANGIDVDASCVAEQGNTPLHVAIRNDNLEIAELLVEHGADVNAVNDRDETITSAVLSKPWLEDKYLPMVQRLIDYGSLTDDIDMAGNTAFMVGAPRNDWPPTFLEAFRILFKNETNIDLQNADGKTSLVLATERNDFLMAEILLECMIEIRHHDFQGICHSLHLAVSKGHESLVFLLLKCISDDRGDRYSATVADALHEAKTYVAQTKASAASSEGLAKKYWDIYSMLLQHGTYNLIYSEGP